MEKLRLREAVQECKLEAQRGESSFFERVQSRWASGRGGIELGLVRQTEGTCGDGRGLSIDV